MLNDAIYYMVFWYILFSIPYLLICSAGNRRIWNAFLIAILPSLQSAFISMTRNYPEWKAIEQNNGDLPFWILVICFVITISALHQHWRHRWPLFGINVPETPYSMASFFASMPIIGPIAAFPLGLFIGGTSIYKKKRN